MLSHFLGSRRIDYTVPSLTGLGDRHFRSASDLTRERNRDTGRTASAYDTNVTGFDPEPFEQEAHTAAGSSKRSRRQPEKACCWRSPTK